MPDMQEQGVTLDFSKAQPLAAVPTATPTAPAASPDSTGNADLQKPERFPTATGAAQGPDGQMYWHDIQNKQLGPLTADELNTTNKPAGAKPAPKPAGITLDFSKAQPLSQEHQEGSFFSKVWDSLAGENTMLGAGIRSAKEEYQGAKDILKGNYAQGAARLLNQASGIPTMTGIAEEVPEILKSMGKAVELGTGIPINDMASHIVPGSFMEKQLQKMSPNFKGTAQAFLRYEDQLNPINKPAVDIAQHVDKNEHPITKALLETAQSFTTPENVALLFGTGGAGVVGSAEKLTMANKLMSVGFSAQAIGNAYSHLEGFKKAYDENNGPEALYQLTHAVTSGALGTVAARGAAGAETPIAPEKVTQAVEATGRFGKNLVEGAADKAKTAVEKATGVPEQLNDIVRMISEPSKGNTPGYVDTVNKAMPTLVEVAKNNPNIKTPMELTDALQERIDGIEGQLKAKAQELHDAGKVQNNPMTGIVDQVSQALDEHFKDVKGQYTEQEWDRAKSEVISHLLQEVPNEHGSVLRDPDLFEADNARIRFNKDTSPIFGQNAPPAAEAGAKAVAAKILRQRIDEAYEKMGIPGVKEWRQEEASVIDIKDQIALAEKAALKEGKWSLLNSLFSNSGWPLVLTALGHGPIGLVAELAKVGKDYIGFKLRQAKSPTGLTQKFVERAQDENMTGAAPKFGQGTVTPVPPAPAQAGPIMMSTVGPQSPMAIPAEHLGNLTTEQALTHELAHAIVGKAVGFDPTDVRSHLHPENSGDGNAASVGMNWDELRDKNGEIDPVKFKDRAKDILTTVVAGPLANFLWHGVDFNEPSLAGDLHEMESILRDLGFDQGEAQARIGEAVDRAQEILERPGMKELIEKHAAGRETGLNENFHYSQKQLADIVRDALRKSNGEQNGKDAEGSPSRGPQNEPGGKAGGSAGAKEPKVNLSSAGQGGHAGGGVASEEELARPGRFVKVSRSGQLSDQGKTPDFNLKPGETGFQVKPDGSITVAAGQETPATRAAAERFAKEIYPKHTPQFGDEIIGHLKKEAPDFNYEVVGSVAKGQSSQHDLDIKTTPKTEDFDFNKIISALEKKGFQHYGSYREGVNEPEEFRNEKTGQVIDIFPNETTSKKSPEQTIKDAGLVYKGEVVKGSGTHMFEHPEFPGKTMALREQDITPQKLHDKVGEKLAEFSPKEQPLTEHALRDAANQFNRERGRQPIDTEHIPVDTRSSEVADAYKNAVHDPNDPAVKASYDALKRDVKDQYHLAQRLGIKMDVKDENPYGLSTEKPAHEELHDDVRNNRHLSVWSGGEPPADHPLSEIDPETGHTYNELFRMVHDIFGHVAERTDFSPSGEETAWNLHRQMFSPEAQPALTTETKGQAAYTYKYGDFPPQKAALLPEKFNQPESTIGAPAGAIDPKTGSTESKAVGLEIYPEARQVLDHVPTAKDFRAFVEKNRDLLDKYPQLRVGWDTTGDKPELNIGVSTDNRAAAERVARALDQRSAWDTKKQEEILTGGAGKETQFPNYPLEQRLRDLESPLRTDNISQRLLEKFGKTEDPSKAGFILSDGSMVPLKGEHNDMIASAVRGAPPSTISELKEDQAAGLTREDFITNEGAIRTRFRTGRGGQEVVFSVPKRGITLEQLETIKKAVGKIGRQGNVIIETVGKGVSDIKSKTKEFAKPSDVEPMLEDIGALPSDVVKLALRKATDTTEVRPTGSTVGLIENPLPLDKNPESGRVSTWDVARALNDFTTKKLKPLELGQSTDAAMVNRAKRIAEDEAKYQLAQNNSGESWYTKDIAEQDRILKEMRPELADPAKMSIFKMAEAVLSSGQKPYSNLNSAILAWDHYNETGEFSPVNPNTKMAWGPRSVKAYGNAMQILNRLISEKGEQGASDWLLSQHPIKELRQYNTSEGGVSGKADDLAPGVMVLGPKRGPFAQNLHGLESAFTADMWVSRTWNRWMGTTQFNEDGEPITDTPRSGKERSLMRQSFDETAQKMGLTTSALQAVLWYYEQALYTAHGAGKESWNFADAAKRVQREEKERLDKEFSTFSFPEPEAGSKALAGGKQ